jgi:hypothetical protein
MSLLALICADLTPRRAQATAASKSGLSASECTIGEQEVVAAIMQAISLLDNAAPDLRPLHEFCCCAVASMFVDDPLTELKSESRTQTCVSSGRSNPHPARFSVLAGTVL